MPYRLNAVTGEIDLVADVASLGGIEQIDGDSGSITPTSGVVNIIGDGTQGVSTSGSGDTLTITVADATTSQKGVLETSTAAESIAGSSTTVSVTPSSLSSKLGSQTSNAIAYGSGTSSALSWTSALTDGQLVIGATGASPAAASLTSSDSTITITAGANSIDLSVGSTGTDQFDADSGTAVPSSGVLNIVGDGELLQTSGAGNTITVSPTTNGSTTAINAWNGAVLQTPSVAVSSDGATITLSVERDGGGDLTVVFSDGFYDWDTTPADTVTLSAGTDTVPQNNYTYFLQSNKTLTNSTAGWPSEEHLPIATILCQSAATLQTDGPYRQQNWTDHVVDADDQGHISDLNFWIRQQNSTYVSGTAQTYTITTNVGVADDVFISTTSGVTLQLHENTFPAFANGDDYYVINDNVTPYDIVNNLNSLLTDSTGSSLTGKYFSLVLWGSVNSNGESKRFINLPSGSYNNQTDLEEDISGYATYSIPTVFKSTGFLISEWKLRHQNTSGGTWTSIDEIDLRGQIPNATAGGGSGAPTTFDDALFRIFDDGDVSKLIAFQASSITTANTRTITMSDYDIDLDAACISAPTDSGTATPSAGALTFTGSAGITTSASGSTVTIIGTGEQVVSVTALDNTDSPYVVLTSDYYLSCDVSAGTLQINLPNAPTTGSIWIVKDSGGDASSNNITVTTVGGVVTIDGSTTFVMNTAYEAANFIFNGTSYEVF